MYVSLYVLKIAEVKFLSKAFYARQPIFNLKNDTIAYELLYRNSPDSTLYNFPDGDRATASVINSAFFGGDPKKIFKGKKLYVNFTEKLLLERLAYVLPSDILVIEVLENVAPKEEVLDSIKELKENQFKIAVDDYLFTERNSVFLDYADIVKIDLRSSKESVKRTAEICRKKRKLILGEKIETEEDLKYAKNLGAVFFQGYYFSKPVLVSNKNPSPMQSTFLRLMVELARENISLAELAKIIQTDAAMTLKFLRFVNFMRNDWMEKIKSVHQAVILAGLKRTKEFIYFIGLNQINQTGIDEVITTGFLRARFCESLSKIILKKHKMDEEMYLMGLMSIVIDPKFDGSRDEVESLPLSNEIKEGLLGVDGIYADIMNVVFSYEKCKWDDVDLFCEKYKIDQSVFQKIYLNCISHANELVNRIGY